MHIFLTEIKKKKKERKRKYNLLGFRIEHINNNKKKKIDFEMWQRPQNFCTGNTKVAWFEKIFFAFKEKAKSENENLKKVLGEIVVEK